MLFSHGLLAATGFSALSAVVASASAASTYIVQDGKGLNMIFSLNVPRNSSDIYFQMIGQTGNDYISFGNGSHMKNSLIFVAYAASDTVITLSPRLVTGHVEPSYTDAVQCDLLPGTLITNDTYIINACCHNACTWNGGSLNVTSTTQPFIFAAGPSNDFQSTSMSAGLRRHQFYGKFTMDITQATDNAGVPTNNTITTGATSVGTIDDDDNYALVFHAVIMVFVFVFIFPVGATFRVICSRLIWHWALQLFGLLGAGIALILGIYINTFYNRTNKYNTAHQIIGLLVMVYLFAQAVMGYIHKLKMVHSIGGRVIMILGIIDGSLGFSLPDDRLYIIFYVILIVGVTICIVRLQFCINRRRARKVPIKAPEYCIIARVFLKDLKNQEHYFQQLEQFSTAKRAGRAAFET